MKIYDRQVLKNLYEDVLTERERRRIAQKLNCAYEELYNQDTRDLHNALQIMMRVG